MPEGAVRDHRPGELVLDVHATRHSRPCRSRQPGARRPLLSLFATDERARTGGFAVHHVWSLPRLQTFLRLSASVDPAAPSFPSIAQKHPAANWFEREVMDFFGLRPDGHPNPTRVALHDDWPDGAMGASQGLR